MKGIHKLRSRWRPKYLEKRVKVSKSRWLMLHLTPLTTLCPKLDYFFLLLSPDWLLDKYWDSCSTLQFSKRFFSPLLPISICKLKFTLIKMKKKNSACFSISNMIHFFCFFRSANNTCQRSLDTCWGKIHNFSFLYYLRYRTLHCEYPDSSSIEYIQITVFAYIQTFCYDRVRIQQCIIML